jgi:hypothetical protein
LLLSFTNLFCEIDPDFLFTTFEKIWKAIQDKKDIQFEETLEAPYLPQTDY